MMDKLEKPTVYYIINQLKNYKDSYEKFKELKFNKKLKSNIKKLPFPKSKLEFKIINGEKTEKFEVKYNMKIEELTFGIYKKINYEFSFEDFKISIYFYHIYNLYELICGDEANLKNLFSEKCEIFNSFNMLIFFNEYIRIYGDLKGKKIDNYFDKEKFKINEPDEIQWTYLECNYEGKDLFKLTHILIKNNKRIDSSKKEGYVKIKTSSIEKIKLIIYLLKKVLY